MKLQTVVTPNQMRMAEQCSVKHGVSLAQLMDNAGEALGRHILEATKRLSKKRVVILAGSGNNGGDGFVCASFLEKHGINVSVVLCCGQPKTELAKAVAERVETSPFYSISQAVDDGVISDGEIIVDCVFGTGFHGEIRGETAEFFDLVNKTHAYKIACDVPSGVNAHSGQVSKNSFKADETVTFHMGKTGLYLSHANELCGKITVADIGIPPCKNEYAQPEITLADEEYAMSLLPLRPENSHKGTFGRVTLVCGSEIYIGAGVISAMSALRTGVGIVNLCTPSAVVGATAQRAPECTFTPLQTDEHGFASCKNLDVILERLEQSSSAVIGCGLGKSEETVKLTAEIVRNAKCPLVVDADGINCLAEHIDVLKDIQTEIILTPHVAELARLCGVSVGEVLGDTFGYAEEISRKYGVTVHAKNTQSLTVRGNSCVITDFGCSALAKGGSGDMLAGIIGSLCAQKMQPDQACVLADWIMGSSAKALCNENSPRGVLAQDIISQFPKTLYRCEQFNN